MDFEKIKEQLAACGRVGDEMDNSRLFIEFDNVYSQDGRRFLNLQTIVVPSRDRQKGFATKIVEMGEEIARDHKYCGIVVGPFVENDSKYIARICRHRQYHKCVPFCMIKQFDETLPQITTIFDTPQMCLHICGTFVCKNIKIL